MGLQYQEDIISAAVEQIKRGGVLVVVARLGDGEGSRELNRRRLYNVREYLKERGGLAADKIVAAEGERVPDRAQPGADGDALRAPDGGAPVQRDQEDGILQGQEGLILGMNCKSLLHFLLQSGFKEGSEWGLKGGENEQRIREEERRGAHP
jgi:hypothetical protein